MLMDRFGYLLSELPTLIFIVWFAVRFFQFRRGKTISPPTPRLIGSCFSARPGSGRQKAKSICGWDSPFVAVTTIGVLEILVLAPFGAAIITGSLLLTSTAIVHRLF
jgi:hypothetical protein